MLTAVAHEAAVDSIRIYNSKLSEVGRYGLIWHCGHGMQPPPSPISESGNERGIGPDGQALLFNAGVRALGAFGFSDFKFDIGGKKSRRRYITVTSPQGADCSIWIKSSVLWAGLADVIRFPWAKRAIQGRAIQFCRSGMGVSGGGAT